MKNISKKRRSSHEKSNGGKKRGRAALADSWFAFYPTIEASAVRTMREPFTISANYR